jgi:hypothetical protein
MGFFKKKKKDTDKEAATDKSPEDKGPNANPKAKSSQEPMAGQIEPNDDNDPLNLATAPPTSKRSADKKEHVEQERARLEESTKKINKERAKETMDAQIVMDPEDGHRVAVRAASLLQEVARETRGLFETVRPMVEAKAIWRFFATDDMEGARTAVKDGNLNPHAAASLIVYHLRDQDEPLCTKALRSRIFTAAEVTSDAERLAELREHCSSLPENSRTLLRSIGSMVAAVAAEHDACYKDGIENRMSALAQLFGPLFLRPAAPKFESEMAAAMRFALDVFANPSLLSPLITATSRSPLSITSSGEALLHQSLALALPLSLPLSSLSLSQFPGNSPLPFLICSDLVIC